MTFYSLGREKRRRGRFKRGRFKSMGPPYLPPSLSLSYDGQDFTVVGVSLSRTRNGDDRKRHFKKENGKVVKDGEKFRIEFGTETVFRQGLTKNRYY